MENKSLSKKSIKKGILVALNRFLYIYNLKSDTHEEFTNNWCQRLGARGL